MKNALVITVGTGQGIESAIIKSIKTHNPDFIVFLVSDNEQSREKIDIVKQKYESEELHYHEFKVSDPNDFEIVYSISRKAIQFLKAKDYKDSSISADFTAGTKPMSAGLVYAAISEKIHSISYVSGQRDPQNHGRVIRGTEKVLNISTAKPLFERDLILATEMFNHLQFQSAIAIVDPILVATQEPEIMNRARAIKIVSEIYDLWDKFEHKKAHKSLEDLIISSEMSEAKKLLSSKMKYLNDNLSHLNKCQGTDFSYHVLFDLIESARRRIEIENKYDDGVARLYRAIEYLAQLRLHEREINSADVDVNRLPENLRQKYAAKKGEKTKLQLGMVEDYDLLCRLGDKVGQKFLDDYEQDKDGNRGVLYKRLNQRNNSILAHGFQPVGEDGARELLRLVSDYTKSVYGDEWDNDYPKSQFIQIGF